MTPITTTAIAMFMPIAIVAFSTFGGAERSIEIRISSIHNPGRFSVHPGDALMILY